MEEVGNLVLNHLVCYNFIMPDKIFINNKEGGPELLEKKKNDEAKKQEDLLSPEKETFFDPGKEGGNQIVSEISAAENNNNVFIAASNAQRDFQAREKKIEKLLESDLAEIFLNMSPEKQEEFAVKGEEISRKINKLLEKAKITLKEIISLIKEWLQIIPGVNKYFVEQEAKIKADEIIRLK